MAKGLKKPISLKEAWPPSAISGAYEPNCMAAFVAFATLLIWSGRFKQLRMRKNYAV